MALVHEWEKRGNTLFKNRSWIPIFFVIAGSVYVLLTGGEGILVKDPSAWILFCSFWVFLGQAIRSLSVGYADQNTSGRNTSAGQVADSINKTGMYSMLRHPLYLGNYFMWLGALVYIGSVEFVIIASMAYWFYYEKIMFAEEQFLRKKFGEEYDKWSENTPAILPRLKNFKKPKNTFDWKDMIRREYLGFCASFYVICIFGVLAHSLDTGTFTVTEEIRNLFILNFSFFLVIRILAKATNLLSPSRNTI